MSFGEKGYAYAIRMLNQRFSSNNPCILNILDSFKCFIQRKLY